MVKVSQPPLLEFGSSHYPSGQALVSLGQYEDDHAAERSLAVPPYRLDNLIFLPIRLDLPGTKGRSQSTNRAPARRRRRLAQTFPLFVSTVRAGFPSPADDHLENELNLSELLVQHPASTFFVRVSGDSMQEVICSGDLLVVDRAIEPANRRIVVAVLDGEFTVKRLLRKGGRVFLAPENPNYQMIEIKANHAFEVWGVVTSVIHTV